MRSLRPAALLLLATLSTAARGDDPRNVWTEEPPIRLQRPTSVRAGAFLGAGDFSFFNGQPGNVGGQVTVAYQASDRVALEGMVGSSEGGGRSGPVAGLGLRITAAAREIGALTLGLGTHAAFLPRYGPVGFAHLELAWELRTEGGFNLVAGGGLVSTLNDSKRGRTCEATWLGKCDDHYTGGSTGPWLHAEAGVAF